MSSLPGAPGFVATVKITVDPSNVDEFIKHLKPCYEAVIAEPECTFFEVVTSQDRPGEFVFWEGWSCTRQEFLATQMTKPYRVPYQAATEPLWVRPREIEYYDRSGWVYQKPVHFTV